MSHLVAVNEFLPEVNNMEDRKIEPVILNEVLSEIQAKNLVLRKHQVIT